MGVQTPSAHVAKERSKWSSAIGDVFSRPAAGAVLAVVALAIIMTIQSPVFLDVENLTLVARSFSFIAIAGFGQLMVIVTKGIDISVGSVMGLAGITTAILSAADVSPLLSVLGGLLAGSAVGLVNGYLVSYLSLTPFMVTLGALNVVRGIDVVITKGMPVSGMSDSIKFLGQGFVFGVPIPVIIMVVMALIWSFILNWTTFGRNVYAIGGNEDAAILSGIPVKAVKLAVYIACAFMASVAGILLTARLGVGEPTSATGYELNIIAATVIGGTSFLGGVGNIFGVIWGAALLGLVVNAMALAGVDAYWQQIVIGMVILAAVVLDKIRAPKLTK